jgi:hypothetical protein
MVMVVSVVNKAGREFCLGMMTAAVQWRELSGVKGCKGPLPPTPGDVMGVAKLHIRSRRAARFVCW